MRASEIKVTERRRRVAGASVADPVVSYAGKRVVCDGDLDGRLARLVPARWGNAAPRDWVPFVEQAIALGKL